MLFNCERIVVSFHGEGLFSTLFDNTNEEYKLCVSPSVNALRINNHYYVLGKKDTETFKKNLIDMINCKNSNAIDNI